MKLIGYKKLILPHKVHPDKYNKFIAHLHSNLAF